MDVGIFWSGIKKSRENILLRKRALQTSLFSFVTLVDLMATKCFCIKKDNQN